MVASTSCAASTDAARVGRVAWLGWALACLGLGCWFFSGLGWSLPNAQAESTWQMDFDSAVMLARQQGKPLHVHFTQPGAPLAARMTETLGALPVAQLVQQRFVNLRLDSRAHAQQFRRWLGSAGVLGSCVLDVASAGEPDVVAVLPGFAEPERYREFLDGSSNSIGHLRELRLQANTSSSARLALGEQYAAQGSEARARTTLQAVQGPRPLLAQAAARLARLDLSAGRVAQARAQLERARSLASDTDTNAWLVTEASVLAAERHVTQAAQLLERGLPALKEPQEHASALLLLGSLDHELGDDRGALSNFWQAATEAQGTPLARAAHDGIRHIQQPDPGHTH